MPSDIVRLVIDGKEFTGWTGVTISMAIDQLADAFSVTAPFDPALKGAFKPFGYQAVQLYIDSDIVLSGRIDKIDAKTDASDRSINMQGRSLTGILGDCSIEGDLEFSGLTLATIARKLCKPFGITVRADADTSPLEVARAEYGQSPADFLNSLAAPRNLFLNSSFDGMLVISSAKDLGTKMPKDNLIEGEAPLLSVSASFDATKRFSAYTAAMQFAGEADLTGSISDPSIKIYRPKVAALDDSDQDATITASRLRSGAYASAVGISASVSGWRRKDGMRWAERQALNLTAPGSMLYKQAKYIIAGATFKLDTGGRTTDLRLVLPETYSGSMPKSEAWA